MLTPDRVTVAFTAFQFLYVGGVYGITWIHIVGSIFPVPILLLVPIRQFIMPWVSPSLYACYECPSNTQWLKLQYAAISYDLPFLLYCT